MKIALEDEERIKAMQEGKIPSDSQPDNDNVEEDEEIVTTDDTHDEL